ncbi:hypothetical protein FT663_00491 [Candidozyma haemuli var. vulneris]|uniref:Endonuclease III homolog n=1 Tax=Candidozyma haemuli TaxID=45357 RepID=A0A2V1ART9_9ASCO|nr:hypothetical protein CXQ85_002245 [[Candida] haemuloni]KAF3993468.1 hypothetical protein FT662_00597 [[Candida] haemuloni var. vulneris]KAF3995438.1 hypothetical protein FT663_00491 [[Candida] haemuloni var. vulneris]PVH20454.1 hypothetical protein CXQ85_002245 [[Candida] haemuloni]
MASKRVVSKVADEAVKRRKSSRIGAKLRMLSTVEVKIEDESLCGAPEHPVKEEIIKQEVKEEPVENFSEIKQEGFETHADEVSPINGTCFSTVRPSDLAQGQPPNWQAIYNEVVAMRGRIITPVDSMGCEKMPDTLSPQLSEKQPQLYRFQLLISLMLSSQTKDEINYEASQNMKKHFISKGFSNGVCIEAIRASSESELDELIKRVGFHRRKAMYMKKACDMLHEKHNGDIPKCIEDVVELPGVGPKMGHLLLQFGWGINSGIGVDVHIHRLAQKWGWVRKSDKPEATRLELESWLPRRLWAQVNPLLVGFGQTVCNSQISNCDVCTLASKGLCKGVNRKLLKGPISEDRLNKLRRQRADLSPLVEDQKAGIVNF